MLVAALLLLAAAPAVSGTLAAQQADVFVAAIAGSFNTPVVFASGDQVTCDEVHELMGPKVVTACVKKGLGRFAARHLSHADACDLIEESVVKALPNRADWPEPLKMDPAELRIELLATPPEQRGRWLRRRVSPPQ